MMFGISMKTTLSSPRGTLVWPGAGVEEVIVVSNEVMSVVLEDNESVGPRHHQERVVTYCGPLARGFLQS